MARPIETAYGPLPAVADWLRANGIDPGDVPLDANLSIEEATEGRVVRFDAVVREAGGIVYDPAARGPRIETKTTPLMVEPPADVQVTALTCWCKTAGQRPDPTGSGRDF